MQLHQEAKITLSATYFEPMTLMTWCTSPNYLGLAAPWSYIAMTFQRIELPLEMEIGNVFLQECLRVFLWSATFTWIAASLATWHAWGRKAERFWSVYKCWMDWEPSVLCGACLMYGMTCCQHCSVVQGSAVLCNAVQCSAVQYSAAQISAVQWRTVQCSRVQYNVVQWSALQYNVVQWSALQYNAVQYSALKFSGIHYSVVWYVVVQSSAHASREVKDSSVMYIGSVQCTMTSPKPLMYHYPHLGLPMVTLYCVTLHCTALHCTALHCIALYWSALYWTALHCTALHCTALRCTELLSGEIAL